MVFSINMLLGIVALVRGAGGRIEGRVRIQKEAFLLGLKGAAHFSPESFGYKLYGPFSRELSDALQNAVAFNLVTESREDFTAGHNRYTYELTSDGVQWLTDNDNVGLEAFENDIELLQQQHWRTLELAATVAYFESRGRAHDRAAAFATALKFKPECKNYVERAEGVLDALDLRIGDHAK